MRLKLGRLAIAGLSAFCLGAECGVQTGPSSADQSNIPVIVGDPFDLDRWIEGEYRIFDATVEAGQLRIEVQFAGGCRKHDFALVRAEHFMESEPVRLSVTLAHDGHGDPCEAALRRTLNADLESIREAWQRAYREPSGTVILVLHGFEEVLRYDF